MKKILLHFLLSTIIITSLKGQMMSGNGGASDGEVGITRGGRSFTGVPVGESKLASFIENLKKLDTGVSTPDEITSAIGKPSHISKSQGREEWKYNFLVTEDSQAAEFDKATIAKVKVNEKIKEVEQAGGDSSHLSDLYFKLMDVQTKVMQKLNNQATCLIEIGKDGKIARIKVQKFSDTDSEVLYVKGDAENAPHAGGDPGLLPNLSSAPSSPKTGQTYLNTTDSHFYGWNGKEWKQLD
jgi:hypothetical protein